ncbi:hypothetical protein EVAR_96658_1 [Eumeta japonica]|uniref:Tc1-like transposase DDE domain-containing protein n=1 Tax=Eumeta variegata TaxID=151549 RepID=A0A4C1SVV4_EUMVA|nr:hypothetical protein EVAR_96658_1 [Eumeta japonica]
MADQQRGHLKEIGAGSRLIILHAGGREGFVKDSLLIFKSSSTAGDYHSSMNFSNFKKWTMEKLIPNLEPRSVIVLDNAAYHNVEVDKKPRKGSLKKTMLEWLQNHNIECNPTMLNSELYLLIQCVDIQKKLVIDEILKNMVTTFCDCRRITQI